MRKKKSNIYNKYKSEYYIFILLFFILYIIFFNYIFMYRFEFGNNEV